MKEEAAAMAKVSDELVCNLAYEGDLGALRTQLLADRSLASRTDQDERTPLHWAASAGHADVAAFLLSLGASPDARDDRVSPLSIAPPCTATAARLRRAFRSLAGLHAECAEVHWTPLHIAVSAGRAPIVQELLHHRAQVNTANRTGQTPLHYAASRNRTEILQLLLAAGAEVDAQDALRAAPLHRAAAQGHVACVELLLEHRASANVQDAQGNTPLHLACEEERTDVAHLLLKYGGSVDVANRDEQTPLQVAPRGLATLLRRASSSTT